MSDRPSGSPEPLADVAQGATPEGPVACKIHDVPPPMERRSFLVWLASALLAVGGLFAGATVVQALVPPSRSIDGKTKVGRLTVAKVADLKVGKPVLAEYGDDNVWIVKTSPTKVVVLDQACPHVRCKLSFNDKTQHFDCPCHASHFEVDGKRIDGPAPRDMDLVAFQVTNGDVVVSGMKV